MADIRVPTLGESVTEATVGKWFKQPGDAVAVDGATFGADLLLLGRAIDGPADRALGELGEAFHFMGDP